jgi:hypothetical protein
MRAHRWSTAQRCERAHGRRRSRRAHLSTVATRERPQCDVSLQRHNGGRVRPPNRAERHQVRWESTTTGERLRTVIPPFHDSSPDLHAPLPSRHQCAGFSLGGFQLAQQASQRGPLQANTLQGAGWCSRTSTFVGAWSEILYDRTQHALSRGPKPAGIRGRVYVMGCLDRSHIGKQFECGNELYKDRQSLDSFRRPTGDRA